MSANVSLFRSLSSLQHNASMFSFPLQSLMAWHVNFGNKVLLVFRGTKCYCLR